MTARNYLIVVLISGFGAFGTLLFFAQDARDYTGSQTRMGGYLEADYAPNAVQQLFVKPLFVPGGPASDYDRPYDIVVIGDSFSVDRYRSWVNELAYRLQVSALVFHIDEVEVDALLANEQFRATPPRWLFYQSSEGDAYSRLSRLARLQEIAPVIAAPELVTDAPEAPQLMPSGGAKPTDLVTSMNVAGHHIKKRVQRLVFGRDSGSVLAVDVACDHCFSHARSTSMLINSRTLDPLSYRLHMRDQAIAGATVLRNIVEANCATRFATVIFPNKVNVYRDYLSLAPPTLYENFPAAQLSAVPLLDALQAAVADKTVDVYAPHDHHATVDGYRVAATAIQEYLEQTPKSRTCER